MYEQVFSEYLEMMKKLLAGPNYTFAEASSREVPKESGVYVIYDSRVKTIIYAGRTRNLRRRLLSDHKRGNVEGSQFRKALKRHQGLQSENQITNYILEHCCFQFMEIDNFEHRIRLEHFTTAVLAPTLNVKLKQ